MNSEHHLDKQLLRRAFDRAAVSYDQAAVLQREVCDRMLSRLDYIKYLPKNIVDAGCGTGYAQSELAKRYPAGDFLAVDIALSMLLQARPDEKGWRRWLPGLSKKTQYLCGDIEQLSLKDACVGMVWSNLAIQWCNDLNQTFAEIYRVLEVEGVFMFSTFGPDTLKELRQAFMHVDNYQHVNRFIDMHDIGDLLVHNGFATPVMDMEYITLTYNDVESVMRDLKAIGAHNVSHKRRPGLMGKTAWKKIIQQYETLRQNGKLPATFEIIYGHAWKPPAQRVVLTPETRRQIGLE